MKTISITLLFITYAMLPAFAFSEEYSTDIQEKIYSIQQTMRKDLSEGHTDRARNKLEQAAGNFHAVEIELGLIQTLMQAGEYRHALSAAAHTQAEHPDTIDSTLLYAWLLAIGGQTTPALQLIETTLEKNPNNIALTLIKKQINARQLISSQIITSDAIQLKPFTSTKNVLNPRQYLTTGILINNGTYVITSLGAVENTKKLQIRNGLGREVSARIEQTFPTAKLALLKLDNPIKTTCEVTLTDKTPFPGNPIYIVGFTPLQNEQADWPQLKVDILGTAPFITSGYPIHIPNATTGSGIFNQQGNLIGIVDSDNNKIMMPLDALAARKKLLKSISPATKLTMDDIYEMALNNTVQVLKAH